MIINLLYLYLIKQRILEAKETKILRFENIYLYQRIDKNNQNRNKDKDENINKLLYINKSIIAKPLD